MYQEGLGQFRWAVTLAAALMAWAFHVSPALAWGYGEFPLSQSVASGTSTFVGFGPVGTNCKTATGGSNCSFLTSKFTASGKAEPGGPFTETGTQTVFFGMDGSELTLNGSVIPSIGAPIGFCAPTFLSAHVVYADGTSDANATGTICCAASPPGSIKEVCGLLPIGPPSTTHVSGLCTSGTGVYAGTQCTSESTASSLDGVHFITRAEAFFTKP
jgi:hypothetical protein